MITAADPGAYDPADAAGTIRALGPWWAQVLDGHDPAMAGPLVRRCVDLVAGLAGAPAAPETSAAADLVAWLERTGPQAARSASGDGAAAAEVAAAGVGALIEVTAQLRRRASTRPRPAGTVAHLHRSDGGVPKTAVEQVEVTTRGVAGDRQASRRHHGRPWQALCIWSAEVIHALAAEGHPIRPGAAGENATIDGVPWDEVRPGARLTMGEVVAEIAPYALPCAQNAQWFAGGDFNRMHHDTGPVSRVYALVVEPGRIAVGDPVHLDPI